MNEIKNINNIFNFNNEINTGIYNKKIIKTCDHFKNNIQVFAECCNKYYDCHLCHNEKNNHKMVRKKIYKVKCINCNCENPPINNCIDCNITFGKKNCNICNIWCNRIDDMFHCEDCGLCRQGNKKDFYHCKTCDICFSVINKDTHKCERYNINDNCPICLNNLYNNNDSTMLLDCNHLIHSKCLKDLIKNTDKNKCIPRCTICKKSVVYTEKYEKKFDNYILENPLPKHYDNWKTEILCNDCCEKTTVKFHTTFHKCTKCKSYNTTKIDVIKERKT
jgi:RING finger/CHY zinc finger protein 1